MTWEVSKAAVFVMSDDDASRISIARLLKAEDLDVRLVPTALPLATSELPAKPSCVVLDARRPGISVLQFQFMLRRAGCNVPLVCVTDPADIQLPSGETGGEAEWLSGEPVLLAAVRSALTQDAQRRESEKSASQIGQLYAALTLREREVIALVCEGLMNKQIAWQLGISEITVKVHRGNATRKMGARSLADLVRMLDTLQPAKGRTLDPLSGPAVDARAA